MTIKVTPRSVAWTFALIVAGIGFTWWRVQPPSKAKELARLLAEIDSYRIRYGQYPTSCVSFSSFSNLTKRFRVYTGLRDEKGVVWETRDVSGSDFTVLVDHEGYEVFVPVGHMKPISFSSFPVWRYDSALRRWQKGRIHWSYALDYTGSYWSKQ